MPHEATDGLPAHPRVATVANLLVRDYLSARSHTLIELRQTLALHHGNQSRAAQALGLTVRQFGYRLRKGQVPHGAMDTFQSVANL